MLITIISNLEPRNLPRLLRKFALRICPKVFLLYGVFFLKIFLEKNKKSKKNILEFLLEYFNHSTKKKKSFLLLMFVTFAVNISAAIVVII